MPAKEEKKVAVVGGGLVGSLLAVFLGQRGLRVHLFESRADIRGAAEDSRRSINMTLSHRGIEALRAVGLEDKVLSTAIPVRARMVHPKRKKQYSIPYGTRSEDCLYSLQRHALNELLLTEVEQTPNVSVHFQSRLKQVDLEEKKLILINKASGKEMEEEVQTDFIFGCDGAYSTVRQQMMRNGRLNYQQEYIEHGYKELTMPPTPNGDFAMESNYLHIWPRHKFMMIALPNHNKSFTLTLFMPFAMFTTIKSNKNLLTFFQAHFPDSIEKIGVQRLYRDYFANPEGKMISIKCSPHFMAGSTLILGDAAHAVVPFYGQGMNTGFEDCLIFAECMGKSGGDLPAAAQLYQETHLSDTHAICDLSMSHFNELCSHVTSPGFLLRKKMENALHYLFPSLFIPLYSMVVFSRIPYSQVVKLHSTFLSPQFFLCITISCVRLVLAIHDYVII